MSGIPIGALFVALLVLILASGFFSGSETALMSLNRYRLRHQAREGEGRAIRTLKLLDNPDRLISLILLGNNFVNILASSIATVIALRLMGEAGIAVATALLTFVVLVFAEVTPKTLATRRTEEFAHFASAVYTPLMVAASPLVGGVNWFSSQLLKLLKATPPSAEDEHLSSDELRTVVNETAGLIPARHREMLVNILDLGTVSVNDIMVPRNEILGINLDDDWDDILRQISESQHNRLPVYRDDIDSVIGFIYLRRMLNVLRSGKFTREYLESHVRETYFIPEGTTLTVQLLNFQRERRRVGLVVDEYGDIQGMLTLEDILEEIVGEFDNEPGVMPRELRRQPDGSYLVQGTTQLRNVSKTFDWNLGADGPKTVNGLVLEHFENFPDQGAVFEFEGHPITVIKVEGNRVVDVRIDPKTGDDD
ncbi:MAG: magnesium/cobalt efflux protein [Gammaproteobacteria bacterium]|nr:MAG: magnesium/cobalt efflux protein [Gammaproteobacteria bacterium]